jgi:hypothetical protein
MNDRSTGMPHPAVVLDYLGQFSEAAWPERQLATIAFCAFN